MTYYHATILNSKDNKNKQNFPTEVITSHHKFHSYFAIFCNITVKIPDKTILPWKYCPGVMTSLPIAKESNWSCEMGSMAFPFYPSSTARSVWDEWGRKSRWVTEKGTGVGSIRKSQILLVLQLLLGYVSWFLIIFEIGLEAVNMLRWRVRN